jgi:hypothetical protein
MMQRPDINLYDSDGSHPSLEGTYLAACTFFTVLTGMDAASLGSAADMGVTGRRLPTYARWEAESVVVGDRDSCTGWTASSLEGKRRLQHLSLEIPIDYEDSPPRKPYTFRARL